MTYTDHAEAGRPDLAEYLTRQRWFAGDRESAVVTGVQALGWLSDPLGGLGVRFELVTVEQSGQRVQYNLPLSYRRDLDETLAYGLVGVEQWAEGEFYVYDALHDPDARSVIMAGFFDPPADPGLSYEHLGELPTAPGTPTVLLAVDQSNTSMIIGEASLLKVFRKVAPGHNPDIEILRVLSLEGSDDVPTLHGWIRTGEHDLAMLTSFLRTATGGWDSARASFRDLLAETSLAPGEAGGDFAAESERLGATTAAVHTRLAELLEVETRGRAEREMIAARLHARLDEAIRLVPTLDEHAGAIRAHYDGLAADDPVFVQRVHGDLHLGQTLRTTHGWKLIDFEGEPAAPLPERVRLDSPLRDVAGMLRSFDYAAHSVLVQVGMVDAPSRTHAQEWVERNRTAFLRGYGYSGDPASAALLLAYELDKAVYEVVYETQHRPEWAEIPFRAVRRLIGTT